MRAGAAAAELGCGYGLASAWADALGQREGNSRARLVLG